MSAYTLHPLNASQQAHEYVISHTHAHHFLAVSSWDENVTACAEPYFICEHMAFFGCVVECFQITGKKKPEVPPRSFAMSDAPFMIVTSITRAYSYRLHPIQK